MNLLSLREHLAMKVLRWNTPDLLPLQYSLDEEFMEHAFRWKPDQKIEQAVICLKPWAEYMIHLKDEDYCVSIEQGNKDRDGVFHPIWICANTMSLAICLAVADATGWDDAS